MWDYQFISHLKEYICVLHYTSWNFLSNPGKLHFEGLVHLLRYTREKKNLGLIYYSNIKDVPLSELLRQYSIKTDKQLMVFYYSIWHDCPDTGRITWKYTVFYQGGPIDHYTHVPGLVYQYSAESDYNTAWNSWMDIAHLRIINR